MEYHSSSRYGRIEEIEDMVHQKDDGRFEMISGHRRKYACEKLGLDTLRCEVVEVSRDEAIILMVDSNAQRSTIAPCDKGRAYKMKLEAYVVRA